MVQEQITGTKSYLCMVCLFRMPLQYQSCIEARETNKSHWLKVYRSYQTHLLFKKCDDYIEYHEDQFQKLKFKLAWLISEMAVSFSLVVAVLAPSLPSISRILASREAVKS